MQSLLFLTSIFFGVNGLVLPRQDSCAVDTCQQALQSVPTASSDCVAYLDTTATVTNG